MVSAGDDLVADVEAVRSDGDVSPLVEFAGIEPPLLCGPVEDVDGAIGRGAEQHGLTVVAAVPPSVEGLSVHSSGGAAVETSVAVVDVGDGGVASAEAEGGGTFPVVREPVDSVEFNSTAGVGEVFEHAASADCGELQGVADEDNSPGSVVGEGGEAMELVGGDHPGFVDDDGRPAGQIVGVGGWSIGRVFEEKLVDCVGGRSGLGGEDFGGDGGGCDAEYGPAFGVELVDRGLECGGLAGAGGADYEDEVGVAGHGCGRLGLGDGDRNFGSSGCCSRVGRSVEEPAFGPGCEIVFLGEDLGCRKG